jgi:HAD superfamily hydrolase (TIGR01509 family)
MMATASASLLRSETVSASHGRDGLHHPQIRAVAFDLFGTLVSKWAGWRAYRELFWTLPPWKWPMARRAALTEPVPTISEFHRRVGVRRGRGPEHFETLVAEDVAAIELFADSIPALLEARARGLSLALLSNLAAPYKQPVFDLGLAEHFDHLVFSCDVGLAKPDPKIYEHLARTLGLEPAQVLMIGDTRSDDVAGAEEAGLHALHIDRSGRRGDLQDFARLFDHPLFSSGRTAEP